MRALRAIIIDPGKRQVREERIDGELATLQRLVGGYIELVYVECLGDASLYCDEEGKLKRKEGAFILRTRDHDPFLGTCVILGPSDHDGNDTETTWTAEEVEEFVTWL